jgi:ADP-heptose:LPS heptosyltransferase
LQDADIGNDPFVIFHPETPAHGRQRQWPVENYIGLGKKIAALYPEMKLLITGTSKDLESNKSIAESIGSMAKVLPPVSLTDYAAVISRAQAMVCGNTGVMHLACALSIPLIALHGPTDPRKWGPVSDTATCVWSIIPCSPCLYLGFEYQCQTNRCMQSISMQEVFEALDRLLH